MTTISVFITDELSEFISEQVELGKVASKAELIRNAIIKFKDDQFTSTILEAKQEIKEGRALTGNLDKLTAGFMRRDVLY